MNDGYNCYQHAAAERVNGIFKGVFLLKTPVDFAEARKIIAQSIQISKTTRPMRSSSVFATLLIATYIRARLLI